MGETEGEPQQRGIVKGLFDRLFGWMFGYPPERCSYTTKAVRIPISEELNRITLAADLYLPTGSKPLGTILMRSPYGRSIPIVFGARLCAARGYQVLFVSARGTFGSGGEFDPFQTEVEDGLDVVKWMRQQSWYTGTFATFGGSYLGFVQWALLCDPPKDMVAATPIVAPHDFGRAMWKTGALDLDIVDWADSVALQEQYSLLRRIVYPPRKLGPTLESIPFAQAVRTYLGEGSPFIDKMIATPDTSDPYYSKMKLDEALDRVDIPVLITTGWHDLFNDQSIEQYIRLKERGIKVTLIAGPWTHLQSGMASKVNRKNFDWIEEHLAGRRSNSESSSVEYYVTGSKEWKILDSFPPPTTPRRFYLDESSTLSTSPSTKSISYSSFNFDPQKPTPTMGGQGLKIGGIVDDTALSKRPDVLTFTSAPLTDDMEICGKPSVFVAHTTDIPFADIFVRISEVNEKGKSHNICDGYKRLDPNRDQNKEIELKLHYCANRFMKGRRIRVYIAGGWFPQYVRNHGVENKDNNATEMRVVEHTVHHGAQKQSRVVLPTVG